MQCAGQRIKEIHKKFMRIGAAQISVTNNVEDNLKNILEVRDWAVKNKLDYPLTRVCVEWL